MNSTDNIQYNSRVRVNAPDAVGIHGKIGTVKSRVLSGPHIIKVSIDANNGKPSFLFLNELELIKPSPVQQLTVQRDDLLRIQAELTASLEKIRTELGIVNRVLDMAKRVGVE